MVLVACEIGGAVPEEENQPAGPYDADLKPEYCRYKDEGCEYSNSCLECPFPRCLYEQPEGRHRCLKVLRNQEIIRLHQSGRNAKELALLFAVSQRTIHRVINRKGQATNDKKQGKIKKQKK